MDSAEAALDRLCDPAAEVSAHYLIAADGRCWQLVAEAQRAWHAGQGAWGGAGDVNSRSIGIELDNAGGAPFAEAQMIVLEELLEGILARHDIPPRAVLGHADMAPGRKVDPGPLFDWPRLARQGLSVWPEVGGAEAGDVPPDLSAFLRDLARFGYPADAAPLEVLLGAFRDRFRPGAEGPLSAADCAIAAELAARWPWATPARVRGGGDARA